MNQNSLKSSKYIWTRNVIIERDISELNTELQWNRESIMLQYDIMINENRKWSESWFIKSKHVERLDNFALEVKQVIRLGQGICSLIKISANQLI